MKHYIATFEDGTNFYFSGEHLPDHIMSAYEDGLYVLIDITDPSNPLEYAGEGNWSIMEELSMDSSDQD